jgi:chromosome segregation ATPase
VHEARIGELEERLYQVEQERDEARAEVARVGQVCDAQVEALGAKLDEARNDAVRLAGELGAERRLTAAYAEQARTHRCNPPGLVDLLIQEGTRG